MSPCAGELEASAVTRLELLGDAVIVLEAVREDSGIARMISDGSRCCSCITLVLGHPCISHIFETSSLRLVMFAYKLQAASRSCRYLLWTLKSRRVCRVHIAAFAGLVCYVDQSCVSVLSRESRLWSSL